MGYVGKEIDAHIDIILTNYKLSQLHDLCLYMYLNELKEYISIVKSSNSDSEKFFMCFLQAASMPFMFLLG